MASCYNINDITVKIENDNLIVSSGADIKFNVSEANYDVIIENAKEKNEGSILNLEARDFIYDKYAQSLTLSDIGLEKIKNANLNPQDEIAYSITFKFTADSENVLNNVINKETWAHVDVNIINAQIITKEDFEAMMKTISPLEGIEVYSYNRRGKLAILGSDNLYEYFDFSDFAFNKEFPNFEKTLNENNNYKNNINYSVNETQAALINGIRKTENFSNYFSDIIASRNISSDAIGCNFYLKFTLQRGFALSQEIESIASGNGMNILLILENGGTWIDN